MRYAANKDGPHAAVVQALRDAGASVEVLEGRRAGVPDLLVGYRGKNLLLEVKSGVEGLSLEQQVWHGCWLGDKPWVVRTPLQALEAVGLVKRRTPRQRERARVLGPLVQGARGRLVSSARRPVNAWDDAHQQQSRPRPRLTAGQEEGGGL